MKSFILLIVCCIALSSCSGGKPIPPQFEEVYTCLTPVMDETYMTLRADIEKALLNQSVDWLKDLETLAKKHGVQTVSCILEVFLHPDTAKTMAFVKPEENTAVQKRAKEFLEAHKVTFNQKK
jgi:hypothetical protein